MARKKLKKKILRITEGLLSTATDVVLWEIYFGLGVAMGGRNSRDVYQAATDADEAISQLNYESFKRAFYQIKRRGLVSIAKEAYFEPKITKAGKKRIESLIPTYVRNVSGIRNFTSSPTIFPRKNEDTGRL